MPTCPKCGGPHTRPIAPGYYECVTPDYADNAERDRCQHRFAFGPGAGAGTPMCACGTYAIGQCAQCGTWLCGDHSGLMGGQRYCDEHIGPAKQRLDDEWDSIHRDERVRIDAYVHAVLDAFVSEMVTAGCPGSHELIMHTTKPRRSWTGKGKGVQQTVISTGSRAWTVARRRQHRKYDVGQQHFELALDGRLWIQTYRVAPDGLDREPKGRLCSSSPERETAIICPGGWVAPDGTPLQSDRFVGQFRAVVWGEQAVTDGIRWQLAATGIPWPSDAPPLQPPVRADPGIAA